MHFAFPAEFGQFRAVHWNAGSVIGQRFVFAVLSGIALGLAFPKFDVAGLGWIAPGLLALSGLGLKTPAAFRVGFAGSFAFYLMALHWLLYIPFAFAPIVGWIALSMYLSVFTGAWVALNALAFPARSEEEKVPKGWFLFEVSELVTRASWPGRVLWTFQAAVLWVALEMIVSRFLTGFPWLALGASQYKLLPVLQIAPFTGVYGVSFLMIWLATSLAVAALLLIQKPLPKIFWIREVAIAATVVALVSFYGWVQIREYRPSDRKVKAALAQPSIPQTLIWDERENSNRFKQLIRLSEKALESKPQLLIWPEASVPTMIRHDEEIAGAIIKLVKEHGAWLILGSDDAELKPGGEDLKDVLYYNSSFAISPEGRLAGNYRKRRLVIFGEYVPLVRQLPFLKYFSPPGTDTGFTPGTKPVPFKLPDLEVTTTVLICFEDVFPHLAREYVQEDTDFLLNLTNNGWFGESAAQWQHAANAVFRAVENRIPLVRCANNGLTCWVDELGAMHEVYFGDSEDIYKAGFKEVEIPLLREGEKRELTFYTRHGDIFGWSCVGWMVLLVGSQLLNASRARSRLKSFTGQAA